MPIDPIVKSKDKEVIPDAVFSGPAKSSAIFGIGVALAIYAWLSGNSKPLFIFAAGVGIAFILFVVNRIMGKLNEQPK